MIMVKSGRINTKKLMTSLGSRLSP